MCEILLVDDTRPAVCNAIHAYPVLPEIGNGILLY
jgi:hypothetical protein